MNGGTLPTRVKRCWVVGCDVKQQHVHVVTPSGTLKVLITDEARRGN